ncbi:hypothetical protein BN130_4023 [Cronobacter malonaticus 507]|nr:hypothetical protein BN130_4023 [Cronobacter malonaticus 507]
MRFLAGGNQILPAVVDVEAAGGGFGWLMPLHRQDAAIFGNGENRNHARGAIAGVEMTAIRRNVDIRRPAGVGEIGRHHIQRLHAFNVAVRIAQRPHIHRAVQLIHTVGERLARVEDHMARPGARDGGDFRWRLRLKVAIVGQRKQADAILLQRRHPQRAVIRGDIRGVAAFQPFYHSDGLARQAVVQAHHAHAACVIGAAEQETAGMIGRNVRRAARQRRFARLAERAVMCGDAIRDNAKFRAHANIEEALVRADDHRLNLPWRIHHLQQRQRALRLQTPDVDLLALRACGINGLFHEYSLLH